MIDREQAVDELFARAIELGPDERRALLIKEAHEVGEDVIDEVRALLRDHAEAEAKGFLQQPLISTDPEAPTHVLSVGQDFEGYKILSLIEEGGMGEVYLAQDNQLERRVAIKLIKSHLKTKEVLRRFHNERQILANLQHPNIAQLFEACATADGLPFFVMEYVEGRSIDKFAAQHELSVTDLLKLFRTVCSAVSYAHQNLVIHRDIKPGNILVGENGEPKLLDFGIAKLLSESDSEQPAATATLFRVMTPEYASPEQVRGEPVTTASDVYSLGVLLYELLTGRRPYKLKRRTTDEITKAICEEEPQKPSTAVALGRGEGETRGQTNRQSAIGSRQLKGDLDNIVLKALRKEPQRRYASVEQLSEDIRRHLEGLPVSARKDTLSYRTSKFIQRNKIGVTAAAIILLILIAGIVTTGWEARKARVESARAQRRFNEVRKLAHSVLFDYHDAIAELPGSTPVRQRLVKDALDYLDNLAREVVGDQSLQRELANAYLKVGDIQGKPSNPNLGDTTGALASYTKAQGILEALLAAQPNSLDVKYDLALACQDIGRIENRMRNIAQAARDERRAIELSENLVAANAENVEYRRLLSSSYLFLGEAVWVSESADDYRAALDSFRKALAIREALLVSNSADIRDRYFAATCYGHIGYAFLDIGDATSYRQALESHRKSLDMMEAVCASDPVNAEYKRALVHATMDFGTSQLKNGDAAGALVSFRKVFAGFEKLITDDPANIEARWYLASIDANISDALATTGAITEALAHSRKALVIYQQLCDSDPTSENRILLIQTHNKIGELLTRRGDVTGALASYREAIAISEAWSLAEPANTEPSRFSVGVYFKIADVYATMASDVRAARNKQNDNWRAARDTYQKSLDIWQDMKRRGTLTDSQVANAYDFAKEIAKCDAALAKNE